MPLLLLQRVRIARYAVIARVILSVHPSVCPSVTFRYCVQMNEDTIVRFFSNQHLIGQSFSEEDHP